MTDTPTITVTSITIPSGADLYAEYRRREAEARAADRADLATLRPALLALARAAGATKITASYEGGGDSGAIDQIHADPAEADERLKELVVTRPGQRWNPQTQAYETFDREIGFFAAVEEMAGMLLLAHVGNWWDGDIETSGEIVWTIADDRLSGEHNETVRNNQYTTWGDPEDDADGDDGAPSTHIEEA
jgi:hypothetical protein